MNDFQQRILGDVYNKKVKMVSDLIQKVSGGDTDFESLGKRKQKQIVSEIASTFNLFNFVNKRRYNILDKKFYVELVKRPSIFAETISVARITIDDFETFYQFINGDIYRDTCFYGYSFSGQEITDYNIQTEKINFDCFIKKRIKKCLIKDANIIKKYQNGRFIVSLEDKKHEHLIEEFSKVFDFIHYLNGDLKGADLLFCDGIENLKNVDGLILDNIVARKNVLEALGLPFKGIKFNDKKLITFDVTNKNELILSTQHSFDEEHNYEISYISDVHLPHRYFNNDCNTENDIVYETVKLCESLRESSSHINLIAGDISSVPKLYFNFFKTLSRFIGSDVFTVLGNHELWPFQNKSLEEIVKFYKEKIKKIGQDHIKLIHNNIYYQVEEKNIIKHPIKGVQVPYYSKVWKEISEKELDTLPIEEIKNKLNKSFIIIFGGIGFSGCNFNFNALNGVYRNVISRKKEIEESDKFLKLYDKVAEATKGKNLIVLTHMPLEDWGGKPYENVVYVNGHNHRNYFFDNGKIRIYADNQIGYKGKNISFKKIYTDYGYDVFKNYKDGIYKIDKEQYVGYYHGIDESVSINRDYDSLYLIKKTHTYMFIMKSLKGTLCILNGGQIKKLPVQNLDFYLDKISLYNDLLKNHIDKYFNFQKIVSQKIKEIDGNGRIHGCIIDIDFLNHVFINPTDGKITAYYADSIVSKYVYDNLPSMLMDKCPKIYNNYLLAIENDKSTNNSIFSLKTLDGTINQEATYVSDTEIYKISRIVKNLQFLYKNNVIRIWDDRVMDLINEKNGRKLLEAIINEKEN